MSTPPISCAFDLLYPDGVGFPEPELIQSTGVAADSARSAGIEVVAELFPARTYGAAVEPEIFIGRSAGAKATEALYRSIATKVAAPVVLVRLARASTFGSIVYATADEMRVVYETQRWNDRTATSPPPAGALKAAIAFAGSPSTDYLFLTSAGSFNYGHVLVDDLPRLKAIDEMRRMSPGRRQGVILTSHGNAIDRVRRQAVAAICGRHVEIRFIDHCQTYAFERLYYASPCSFHPVVKNPFAIEYLRGVVGSVVGEPVQRGRRLYVGRSKGESRQLLNGRAVAAHSAAHSYEHVCADQLTFIEQARLFAGADDVLGQMGAAMTNTLFCPAGSKIAYLAPEGWVEPFYWDLAVITGHRYRVLFGATPEGAAGPAHLRDCSIDLADLAALIDS